MDSKTDERVEHVLKLVAAGEMSYSEIGATCGITRNAVSSIVYRSGKRTGAKKAPVKRNAAAINQSRSLAQRVRTRSRAPNKPLPPELRPVVPLEPPTMAEVLRSYASQIYIASRYL